MSITKSTALIDEYNTIAAPSTGVFKDRGSKFFAYAYPIESEADVAVALQLLKKDHLKARHHCYAYRIGMDGNQFRANDDGEPSGTAGKPILGQLDKFEVTDVLVVVVRYFGGTKLGTSGLINAYKNSAAEALTAAKIIRKTICAIYRLSFDYAIMGDVMSSIKKVGLQIVGRSFELHPYVEIAIPTAEVEQKLLNLKAQIAKVSLEEAETLESIEGLEIVYLRLESML